METKRIHLREVGPREGFQFEGIGDPTKISTDDKVRLVDALSDTGVECIQVTSFVHPKRVPQMADAEEVSRRITCRPGVRYDALYLNDKGLERALDAKIYDITGKISLTASETFCKMNQNRDWDEDIAMQRRQLQLYQERGIPVRSGSIMAAFGCNYEGDITLARVLEVVKTINDLADEFDVDLAEVWLADTMGWADPEQVKRTVGEVRSRWPELEIGLHLHDTRGTGMANAYAALEAGVTTFDTSVGGLGGCPFAKTVAGNIPTEDMVFMCERMGIETGVNLDALIECAKLAEEVVGHPLPSKVAHASA